MNSITEKFWYTSEDSKNMRVVVSALTEHPTVFTVVIPIFYAIYIRDKKE